MGSYGYPTCSMGHQTRSDGSHMHLTEEAAHKPPNKIYRVRIDPKDEQVHAILVFVKCEEGPVVAGLKALQRLTDIAPMISAEHVTSVHQCKAGEPK